MGDSSINLHECENIKDFYKAAFARSFKVVESYWELCTILEYPMRPLITCTIISSYGSMGYEMPRGRGEHTLQSA